MPSLVLPPSSQLHTNLQGTCSSGSSSPASRHRVLPSGGASNLSASQFPVLDWADWADPSSDAASQGRFLAQLRNAAVGLGFFVLRGSPLDQGRARADLFDLSAKFFALPLDQRMAITITNSPHFRGYSKFADERTLGAVDNRDQIDFGTDVTPQALWDQIAEKGAPASQVPDYVRLYGPNQYVAPGVLPGHTEVVKHWFSTCSDLSDSLTGAIEAALGLTHGALLAYLGHAKGGASAGAVSNEVQFEPIPGTETGTTLPYSRMKTIRYPAGTSVDGIDRTLDPQGTGTQGVGAHRDGGWLTLLAVSDVPGLEVQDVDGTWLAVPAVQDAVVVNFGQQFEVLTRGLIRAATHRVTIPKTGGRDRFSVAFFSTPALNCIMRELPPEAISAELHEAVSRARAERGGQRLSDVPEGDLHSTNRAFGTTAWSGLTRSHPTVVQRWYPWLLGQQTK